MNRITNKGYGFTYIESRIYFTSQLIVPVGGWIIHNLNVLIYFAVFFVVGSICLKFTNVKFNIEDKNENINYL